VHPTGRRERESLPEADRTREMISVYFTTAIDTARTSRAPVVLYQGREYEIVRVGDYLALGGIVLVTAALRDEVVP